MRFNILAPGYTLNDITDEEWKVIENGNTISISCTPYTGKKFNFYMNYESTSSSNIFIDMMAKNGYTDTILLLGSKESIEYAFNLGFKKIIQIHKGRGRSFNGKYWYEGEKEPPSKLIDCFAPNFKQGLFRFRGSLSASINAAIILKASDIRLIGVELDNMKHFYEGTENKWAKDTEDIKKIEEYHKGYENSLKLKFKTQKDRMKGFDPNTMHTTTMPYPMGDKVLVGMHKTLGWMDRELRKYGHRGIFITNKKSILYRDNILEYKGILDE